MNRDDPKAQKRCKNTEMGQYRQISISNYGSLGWFYPSLRWDNI